jgi:hypothetical protein
MPHEQDCFYVIPKDIQAALVGAVVAALAHSSPYCVAAAAAFLGWVARTNIMGRAWIETSGTIPALIDVVERMTPPADLEKESGLFRRWAPQR